MWESLFLNSGSWGPRSSFRISGIAWRLSADSKQALNIFELIMHARNVLFWNLNYWDSASTLAGEVRDPRRVFPQARRSDGPMHEHVTNDACAWALEALFIAMMIVISSYVFPLFVGVGHLPTICFWKNFVPKWALRS